MNVTLSQRFVMPARFHPGYSPVGRWVRRRVGDARRAEAYFILTLVGAVAMLALAQYVAWALVQDAVTANPGGPAAMAFWGGQVAAVALYALTCVLGFQPSVEVAVTPDGVRIRQGKEALTLASDEVLRVETIPALVFHRHHRRYAGTRVFVTRMPPEVLLLHTREGPVALGLAPGDRAALIAHLQAQASFPYETARARVA